MIWKVSAFSLYSLTSNLVIYLWSYSFTSQIYPLAVGFLLAAQIGYYSFKQKLNYGIYAVNLLVALSLFNFTLLNNSSYEIRLWLLVGLSLLLVLISELARKFVKMEIFNSGLIIALVTAVSSFSFTFVEQTTLTFRLSGLFAGYIASGLLAYLSYRNGNKRQYWYTSLVAFALLVMWQFHLLELTDIQWYLVPLVTVALIMGFDQKRLTNTDNSEILNLVSGLSLVGISASQAADDRSLTYSGLLVVYGLALLSWGNYSASQILRIIGVLAFVAVVLIQTQDFILSLPRWLLVGLGGLVVICVAVFLLFERNRKQVLVRKTSDLP